MMSKTVCTKQKLFCLYGLLQYTFFQNIFETVKFDRFFPFILFCAPSILLGPKNPSSAQEFLSRTRDLEI